MELLHRDELHRGGFAGLRETRLIMDPLVWGAHREPGTWPGLGRLVYLADAVFNPRGDTRMHPHREIDVLTLMVNGRIAHEGSLEHGQELRPNDVQVQRAGGEGFTHNEINPDDTRNRMIQFWVVPEVPGEPASYRLYHVGDGQRVRVYGGAAGQDETFAAGTVLEVARVRSGGSLVQNSGFLAYLVSGAGVANEQDVREGHLLRGDGLDYQAAEESLLILAWEMQDY
jgi:redox-sensitive bicupin YhaK (pirin superfamily)